MRNISPCHLHLSHHQVIVLQWEDLPAVIKAVTKRRLPPDAKYLTADMVFVREAYASCWAWDMLISAHGAREYKDPDIFVHEMEYDGNTIKVAVTFCK